MILPVTVKQSLLLLSVFCTVKIFEQVNLTAVFCNDMVLQGVSRLKYGYHFEW